MSSEASGKQAGHTQADAYELAMAIGAYCQPAISTADNFITNPNAKSIVANEATEERAGTAYAHAIGYLFTAVDHLWGLSATMRLDQPPHTACYTLARSTIEATARASWLLDEGITFDHRIARGLVERLNDAHQEYLVHKDRSRLDQRIAKTRARAAGHSLSEKWSKRGELLGFSGEQRPSATDAVNGLMQKVYGTGEDHTWLFALLSGYAHAANFARLISADITLAAAGGFGRASFACDFNQIYSAAYTAYRLHGRTLGQLERLAGWPPAGEQEPEASST